MGLPFLKNFGEKIRKKGDNFTYCPGRQKPTVRRCRVLPITAEIYLQKIGEKKEKFGKREEIAKKRQNRGGKSKTGKVLSLCFFCRYGAGYAFEDK